MEARQRQICGKRPGLKLQDLLERLNRLFYPIGRGVDLAGDEIGLCGGRRARVARDHGLQRCEGVLALVVRDQEPGVEQ